MRPSARWAGAMSITTKRPGATEASRTPCTSSVSRRSPATSSRVSPGATPIDALTHADDSPIGPVTSDRRRAPAPPNRTSPTRSTPNSGTCSPVAGTSAKLSMRGENASGSTSRTSSP